MNRQPTDAIIDAIVAQDYPEVLRDMVDTLFAAMSAMPELSELSAPARAQLAFDLVERLRERFSGSQFYFPKGSSYMASRRAVEIYDRFNGGNLAELVREFKLSEQRIRQLIEQVRRERAKNAPRQLELGGNLVEIKKTAHSDF